MPLCYNCIQIDTFWINVFFFFMISLLLVASQSMYTPKWSSVILKMNSLSTNCCLGREPFRGNCRCTDLCELLLIIFQLVLVSVYVCVCSFFNALTFSLLCFWFPVVSLFLCLLADVYEILWLWMRVYWTHSEGFCWKQTILCIKFRSLSVSRGCECEWPWFARSVYGKWVLSEKLTSTEGRQEEGASEIAGPSRVKETWRGLGSREPEVIHNGLFALRMENTSSPKRCFLMQDMLRWLKGLKHFPDVVIHNINVLGLF